MQVLEEGRKSRVLGAGAVSRFLFLFPLKSTSKQKRPEKPAAQANSLCNPEELRSSVAFGIAFGEAIPLLAFPVFSAKMY